MAKLINLEQFKPKHHPVKAELKKYGISNGTLANYLEVSYQHATNMLNGICPLPAKHEKKINDLLFSLKYRKDKLSINS